MLKRTTPITEDGEYHFEFSDCNESARVFVECNNSAGECVNGEGTATIYSSINGKQWRASDEGDTVINLNKTGPMTTYVPPIFLGGTQKIKVIISGMLAGTSVHVLVWHKS